MNLMTLKEIKNLESNNIDQIIIETQQKIFDLKFKLNTKQKVKSHHLKAYKKMLAQLLTINHNLTQY